MFATKKYSMSFKRIRCKLLSTVFALSSGQGKYGVAVIRVTGRNATDVFKKICTKPDKPRIMALRTFLDPENGEKLDKGMICWFPGPHSYTGEDMVEFYCHGGPMVIKAIITALSKLSGFYPAKPGDFTKRAFYNNKLDLPQIEGLSNLIHAESEGQRKQAFRQLQGNLSNIYTQWRNQLLYCISTIDAYIDFSETDDIKDCVIESAEKSLKELLKSITCFLNSARAEERLCDGITMAIVGQPNAGKSTFLNEIVGRSAAIVTPIRGTTRDVIQVPITLNGYPVNICDTAGLTKTDDVIENIGITKTKSYINSSDIVLIMVEAKIVLSFINAKVNWNNFLQEYLQLIEILPKSIKFEWYTNNNYIIFVNKIDLLSLEQRKLVESFVGDDVISLSLLTKHNFSEAMNKISDLTTKVFEIGNDVESSYILSARHRIHIEACKKLLIKVLYPELEESLLSQEYKLDVASAILNSAAKQLGYVVGEITTEDILDHIFSNFCIGK